MAILSRDEPATREELMHAYLEAWNSHDPDEVAEFFAPDAVYDDRGADSVARGKEAIRAHVASVQTAFFDLDFELVRAAHGNDFTAGEWAATMTHTGELEGLRATGRRIHSAGVDVAMLDREGRIAHLVSYYDGAAIMRQLGLFPPRSSRIERMLLRSAPLLPPWTRVSSFSAGPTLRRRRDQRRALR
jgi:steroid delta-isomerase-like uncharacterized protein